MDLRPVGSDDLELICHHRVSMFRDMGYDLEPTMPKFREWLRPRLADGRYFGVVAEEEGVAVAGVGLIVLDWPPTYRHPDQDRRGYVLNVYVEPTHRRRGIAQRMMVRAEEELKVRGVSYATLHASDDGRALYEGLGWSPSNEMSKAL